MKETIKISAVSYLNTLPFIYGLENVKGLPDFIFEKDIPSTCAKKLINNDVDIALIPIAAIPHVKEPYFVTKYCLGAINKVHTVLLLSDVPIKSIDTILLDYQSRTSVNLIKVLAAKHWDISPKWIDARPGFEEKISGKTAGVVIGDRAFSLQKKFSYKYDLSGEWYKMTGLPFVFATWVANKPLKKDFLDSFNKALQFGLNNLDTVINDFNANNINTEINIEQYLKQNISFDLDQPKMESMKLFFDYLFELELIPRFKLPGLTS